ncbi:S8 family serine peptidase [Microbacterium sp. SSW1-47]|uniref:S8 family serine peptidase n=1 Tax=Microbacterium TaxID=33882 RepID=UPI00109B8867|nr:MULTISPECIES: S8 family serine peptidase [Microbacterium]MBN6190368.1 S8 family serine peptidase [Aneurinibacillus sp. BA2021]MCK2026783.1 S8 family serine peptidase [Microbacterium sufflavum]
MTGRRMLRSVVAAAAVATTVLLLGSSATAATPPPIPDDPADPVRAAEYWLDGARIREAWQTTRGEGTTIAVIDTGIGKVPQTFGDAVVGGTDVSGTGTPDGRTPLGAIDGNHGSWVASLAAGRGAPDGTGMIGVAPEAKLLSVSVGFGAAAAVPFTEQVAKAMRWAVDNGADIINLSFTTNTLDWDESWDDAFLYAFEHDVVVVVAAGNRGSGTNIIGAPATIPGVLTVGGVDQTGTASIEASTQGITIGISAPSEGLLGVSADGEVVKWNGTSGAAPIVAGIAALIRSAHPDISANDVINRIIKTAIPVPDAQKPRDPLYGYGLVDAAAAISATLPSVDTNPMGDLAEWIRLFRRAESEPAPQPELTPVAVPPLPDADQPSEAGSPLLPSAESLRYGTLPLVALTVPGILIALGVTAAARRIRSARVPVRHNPDSEE